MNIVYIISVLILLIVIFYIQKQAKAVLRDWCESSSTSSKFISVLAITTCSFAIIFWFFLIYWTISSWQISLDPSRPKPYFLITYVLGLFSVGIFMFLSQFFSGINKIKEDNSNKSGKE
jgi:hypothetical protein